MGFMKLYLQVFIDQTFPSCLQLIIIFNSSDDLDHPWACSAYYFLIEAMFGLEESFLAVFMVKFYSFLAVYNELYVSNCYYLILEKYMTISIIHSDFPSCTQV